VVISLHDYLDNIDPNTLESNEQSHVVMQRITEKQNNVVITDRMWARLLSSTNQPSFLRSKDVIEVMKQEAPPTQLLDGENSKTVDN
jgi:6-phosphofructokinase 1